MTDHADRTIEQHAYEIAAALPPLPRNATMDQARAHVRSYLPDETDLIDDVAAALLHLPAAPETEPDDELVPGSVVQITDPAPDRRGWLGALVLVTEVKPWGVQGFVHVIKSHTEQAAAYIRLEHGKFEPIGKAPLVPASVAETKES